MPKAKILIVDDEEEIVRLLTLRLRAEGYEVFAANDGLMATKMAIQKLPDLVIMDIGMPCGNGHTVAERLKNNLQTMCMPIIFLTARTSEEDQQKAAEVNAAGYLTKPFKAQELKDTIARALQMHAVRA